MSICSLLPGEFNSLLGPHRRRYGVILSVTTLLRWRLCFYTCIYDLFYTASKRAIFKKILLLQDRTEVAVFARIKEAGSRDDRQPGI